MEVWLCYNCFRWRQRLACWITVLLILIFSQFYLNIRTSHRKHVLYVPHNDENDSDFHHRQSHYTLGWFARQASDLYTTNLIDVTDFHYLTNSDVCRDHDVFLLILVASKPDNFQHRLAIRQTWGSIQQYRKKSVKLGFLLAKVLTPDGHIDKRLMGKINDENERFGDIIVGSFIDSYVNMTYKHIMALHWAWNMCGDGDKQQPRYLLKADDDIYVDPYRLIDYLIYIKVDIYRQNYIFCNVVKGYASRVVRDKSSKWYIPPTIYKESRFPPYCWGPAIIYPKYLLPRIIDAANKQPYFWIDDVHVSGILIESISRQYNQSIITNNNTESILSPIKHKDLYRKFSLYGVELTDWMNGRKKMTWIGGLIPGNETDEKLSNMKIMWNMTHTDRRKVKKQQETLLTTPKVQGGFSLEEQQKTPNTKQQR